MTARGDTVWSDALGHAVELQGWLRPGTVRPGHDSYRFAVRQPMPLVPQMDDDPSRLVEIQTVTLSRCRVIVTPDDPPVEGWRVERDQLPLLADIGDYFTPRPGSTADVCTTAASLGGPSPLTLERIERLRDEIDAGAFRREYQNDFSGTTTGRLGSVEPLTAERLRGLVDDFDGRYPELRRWRDRMRGSDGNGYARMLGYDYASAERRMSAMLDGCGPPPPRERGRQSAPLRPVEDWSEEAEHLIEEHRRTWLGDVENLPDARPVTHADVSDTHWSERNRHAEQQGERGEALAGPVDWLPALED